MFVGVMGTVLIQCEDDGPSTPTLAEAWGMYEAREFDEAATAFRVIIDDDASLTDASHGLAWACAMSGELDSAAEYFTHTIERDAALAAPHAGLCAVYEAQNIHKNAVTQALLALDSDSLWVFDHDSTINYEDVRLILAQAYFGQGEESYTLAQEQVDRLDPDNGLDAADSETWGEEPTYAAALLKEIQEIEEWVGAEMML